MKDLPAIRKRYLRDDVLVRLGGLAANLARIKSFSDNPDHRDVVEHLIEESKFFIEWTALDTEADTRAELIEMQVELALWSVRWQDIWVNSEMRAAMSRRAGDWSRWVLQRSGFLQPA